MQSNYGMWKGNYMNAINWITSHQVLLAGFIVAIIDFIMALVPSIASNGILHSIYLFFKGIASPSKVE